MGEGAHRNGERRRDTGPVLPLGYFRPRAAEDPPNDRLPLESGSPPEEPPEVKPVVGAVVAFGGTAALWLFVILYGLLMKSCDQRE